MRSDFLECWNLTDPDRRVGYYLKLMEFVIPKPSSITVDMELKQLENLLSKAPQQAIDQIAEKLNELHEQNNEHDD
ncbi:MAG: hypothetical protein EOM06_12385 [Sphingobacteriia bacterium]|nr:hypothetical protein [Sphingobacteriia bacterium]